MACKIPCNSKMEISMCGHKLFSFTSFHLDLVLQPQALTNRTLAIMTQAVFKSDCTLRDLSHATPGTSRLP